MSKVVKAVGKAISGVVKAVVGVVKAVVGAVGSVIGFLTNPFMGPMDAPGAGQEAARQDGVLVQKQGTTVNIPVVYGMRKIGGSITFAETGASNNQYLWVAYVLSEGNIEGIRELFIDDYQIDNETITELMATPNAIVNPKSGKYRDRVQLQFFPGIYYTDPASSSPVGNSTLMADAPNWKTSMYYNGMAVLFCRFFWKKVETQADADNNPYSGSIPKVQATILGRKVASLITNDSESYNYQAAGYTERYSTNPAEILLDYLRNPRYGKGLKNTDIDWDTWRKAAVKCNQTVTYVNDIQGPIMTCNYVLDTAQTLFQNTKLLLQGFRAYMPYVQGKYKLRIEDAGNDTDILSGSATIVATFNQDNIQGNVQFTGIDRGSKYTAVAVTYVDPDNKYSTQQVVFPETEAERQVYIDLDGGRENKLEATFATITNYAMAKDFARMLFNKSRRQESCSLTVTSQGLELEPGDNIRIQSNMLDFGDDPWRIISFKINDDMTVELGCVRNPDDIYPHTRVGEEDVVLPIFVPKGATIYYPTSSNDFPQGLVPPPFVPGWNQSNPNGSSGGGVGSPGGPINIKPPQPSPIEEALLLTDVADIKFVRYKLVSGKQVETSIDFVQPDHAMFESVDFWIKGQTDNGYKQHTCTIKPGPGNTVSYVIPELFIDSRSYECFARVNYSTGEKSQAVVRFSFVVSVSAGASAPNDTVSIVESGWKLPEFKFVSSRANNIGVVYATAATSSGQRQLNFSVQENCLNTVTSEAPNPDIVGVIVYWRLKDEIYWNSKVFRFQPNYLSGDFGTFTFDGDIGETSDATQVYDFIVRFYYKDERQSTRQRRFMNVNVTNTSNPFGVFIPSAVIAFIEGSGDFTITDTPPGAVADPLDVTVGVAYAMARSFNLGLGGTPTVRFGVIPTNPGNDVFFRGLRLYYRPYDPLFRNNPWRTVDSYNLVPDQDGLLGIPVAVNFNYVYDWLIVPLVRTSAGIVETNQCWSMIGRPYDVGSAGGGTRPDIPTETYGSLVYGSQINYKSVWSPSLVNTNEALNRIQPVKIQANATVQTLAFNIRNIDRNGCWLFTFNQNYLRSYYTLTVHVGHIGVSFHSLRVYRRHRYSSPNPLPSDLYWGTGRWEFITELANAADANGNITMNLRAPTHFYEYNRDGTVNTLYNNSLRGIPVAAPTDVDEFLVVVRQSTDGGSTITDSPKGILLKGAVATPSFGLQDLLTTGVNGTVPPTVDTEVYNTGYQSGYNRRLSEARAATAFNNLTAEAFLLSYPGHNSYQRDLKGINVITQPTPAIK